MRVRVRSRPTFLVADDDPSMRRLMTLILEGAFPGAAVHSVAAADKVAELAGALRPDVILMDWVFPGGATGASVCRQLKTRPATRRIPVILVTGQRNGLRARFAAVRRGADLFLEKPFRREEVVGYTRALLERRRGRRLENMRLGAVTLDRAQRTVWEGTRIVAVLSPRAFGLLWALGRRSPLPISKRELVRMVWGDSVRDKHVDLAVARLRRQLVSAAQLSVEALPAAGYRLRVL